MALVVNLNGQSIQLDVSRIAGGPYHSRPEDFLRALANAVAPNVVTSTLATGGNVALVSRFNTVLTTANGTIATANINFPANPTDGEIVTFCSTGAITQVNGGANSSASIPAVTTVAAGGKFERRYDAASGKWLPA